MGHINVYQISKKFHSLPLRFGAYWAVPDLVNIVTLRLRMMWGILGHTRFRYNCHSLRLKKMWGILMHTRFLNNFHSLRLRKIWGILGHNRFC